MLRCMRRYAVPTCTGLLMAAPCLAYGGWKTNSFAGALGEVLPLFAFGLLLSLVPYAACSILMEKTRYFYVPLIADLLYTICVLMPNLVVMGEAGPAHVAIRFTAAAGVVFPALLLTKFGIMAVSALRREKANCDAETGA
jgi:hypothetical protein